MARRLDTQPGEWIDREQKITFEFEGREFSGFEGDVITSALIANDEMRLGRSFKYHRPRGTLSFANHDANVLLESTTSTNIRADVQPIEEGASYRAVNTLGGLRYDLTRVLQAFSRFLPVGFYYKAFYRPRWLFPLWEKLIRRLAGLGRINAGFPTKRYPKTYRKADVVVIGGGPAGMAAALEAAEHGLSTMIVEEGVRLGGSYDYLHTEAALIDEKNAHIEAINSHELIEIFPNTYVAGYYDDGYLPLIGRQLLTHVQAGAVIFATGLIEQPAVFRHNDLPGVMLATAALRLVNRYAVCPYDRAVIFTSNAAGYLAALDLQSTAGGIVAIVDSEKPESRLIDGESLSKRAKQAGIQVFGSSVVKEAVAAKDRVTKVVVSSDDGGVEQSIACDGLLTSVGWAPNAALLYQAGATLSYDETLGQILPDVLPKGVYCAGRINGHIELSAQKTDALHAAQAAAAYLGCNNDVPVARPIRPERRLSNTLPIFLHPDGKEFIDFDEDLTLRDMQVAFREGFDSIELLKRFSTIGMGPSQGKTSNMNGVRWLANQRNEKVGVVGVTTPRPFLHPVPMGVLGGRRIRRYWTTPMHEYHQRNDANMMEAGTWLRPMSYGSQLREGLLTKAIAEEYAAVRERVGMIDVSTLGKIELFGPDVIPLLEYAYTAGFDKLKTGMTRYIFMVDGSGTLTDDGVAARFADNHFYITATSSHAQAVVRQLQLNADQLDFDVAIVDRTFQVAAMNLAGPRSREVLERLTELDLSEEAFPYLAARQGQIGGIEATIMRVGFVGELGFEIHCPANSAASLWEALMETGAAEDIRPFGVDTQRLLRLEKGHLIFGQDTDGTTNPYEVNLGWGVRLSKPRFNGKHSLAILKEKLSRRLVGFKTGAVYANAIEECHLVIENGEIAGRVTSVSYSPHCEATIGLAVVPLALSGPGQIIRIRLTDGALIQAQVVETPFYDPQNDRQKLVNATIERGTQSA
ncbi:MAG: 2Fe-2S iron-sulfur cluster-binding protein [Pseudomonadota bacterium]